MDSASLLYLQFLHVLPSNLVAVGDDEDDDDDEEELLTSVLL